MRSTFLQDARYVWSIAPLAVHAIRNRRASQEILWRRVIQHEFSKSPAHMALIATSQAMCADALRAELNAAFGTASALPAGEEE